MRTGQLILFLVVVLTVLAGWHYYLWLRLVRDPAWPGLYTKLGTGLVAGLFAAIPLGMIGSRALPPSLSGPVSYFVFGWFGLAFLLFVLLVGLDVASLVVKAYSALTGEGTVDPERRIALARIGAGAAGLGGAALGAVAVRSALSNVQVREVPVVLDRLPRALSGMTILQMCDIHVGPTIRRRFVESLVERTNAEKPDVVVIVGDLVDGSVRQLRNEVEPLSRLRARYGVYFVTGNHEYYSGVDEWLTELRRLGIRVLRNERVTLGDRGASIDLAGVDDASARAFGRGHGADYAKALADLPPDREVVLLAHQPRQVFESEGAGVSLQLSGHTHGGQIWPFGTLVRLVEPYVHGLHRHNQRTQIYVSRGTGYWGPPMRLWAPAEITKIVLT